METHRCSSRATAEEFLRHQGLRFWQWQTAPEGWGKADGQTNLNGAIANYATGTVVINPGSAVPEIVEERQRRDEQRAQICAWNDDGGHQRPARHSTAAQPRLREPVRLMRWRRPCLVEAGQSEGTFAMKIAQA